MSRFIWLTIIFLIATVLVLPIKASPQTVVKVEPNQSFAEVGKTFTINVTLTDAQNLYELEVQLFWNSSILKVVGVDIRLGVASHTDGVLHEISGTAPVQIRQNETSQDQGRYILAASSMAPAPPFSGSGTIARITFNVTKTGTCTLSLQTKLYDKPLSGDVSQQITHSTQNGVFGKPTEWPYWSYIITIIVILVVIVTAILYYRSLKSKQQK